MPPAGGRARSTPSPTVASGPRARLLHRAFVSRQLLDSRCSTPPLAAALAHCEAAAAIPAARRAIWRALRAALLRSAGTVTALLLLYLVTGLLVLGVGRALGRTTYVVAAVPAVATLVWLRRSPRRRRRRHRRVGQLDPCARRRARSTSSTASPRSMLILVAGIGVLVVGVLGALLRPATDASHRTARALRRRDDRTRACPTTSSCCTASGSSRR